jgi:spermidine/putrescine ABC transporter ATP-binding subunit
MKPISASGEIELIGVGKRYGANHVVSEINVKIKQGEFFSLLGPSGSGKTTTLMMIAGFSSADEGDILLGGVNISDVQPSDRGFGMVFQNYALFPHMSVAENVAFPLKVRGMPAAERREKVSWALETVRLTAFATRAPRQLSGGQQQRVALARAIVYQPKVILMDEPLGALDKNLRFQMQTEIKEIQRRLGITVIYVTHDQEEAMNMSDRLAIMRDGKIVQMGPPADVYQHPTSPFVARFLGEANLLLMESASKNMANRGDTVFICSETSVHPAGSKALLFVRPEKLRLSVERETCFANQVRAKIAEVSYLGSFIRYGLDVDGESLTADIMNLTGMPAFALGDIVWASWTEGDCRLLPDDRETSP